MTLLWRLATQYSPGDGDLSRAFKADVLEARLRWTGKRGRLVAAMLEVRLLDPPLRVHNWEQHQREMCDLVRLAEARGKDTRAEQRDLPLGNVTYSEHFNRW